MGLLLAVFLLISILSLFFLPRTERRDPEEMFFGVSFGQDSVKEAKSLIDRVKNYTNFFLINSWNIATNQTALNQVSEYAVESDLKFMVFFDFVSHVAYPWHQTWLDTAKERYGDHFLGVYLYDEPGGKQIDEGQWRGGSWAGEAFINVSNYDEAAEAYVSSLSSMNSTLEIKNREIPMFTSDYALYWFDYLAGYDTVFVELGWNHSTPKHIALCRGAANVQGEPWGAIITWTYQHPPYLASGPKILEEMKTAYHAGAKYLVVFNYARTPEGEAYNILNEEHYQAMQDFWKYIHDHPERHGQIKGEAAFVLPSDYGWGMRYPEDRIWGLWPADERSQVIWEKMKQLLTTYGLKLDIIYPNPKFNYREKYSKVYLWNTTITQQAS